MDGHEEGPSPIEVGRLHPGKRSVVLELDGHKDFRDVLELQFQENRELDYVMLALLGKLKLSVTPKDAVISVDGETLDRVDPELSLAEGKHILKADKVGFQPFESEVFLREDEALELEIALVPIKADIKITSTPSGATVSLGEKSKGATPMTLEGVAHGSNIVQIKLPGHQVFEQRVLVKESKLYEINALLTELPGSLSVTSSPKGGKVKINGVLKGESPQELEELKADIYTVSVSKDGYHPEEVKKKVIAGEKTDLHFDLREIVVTPPPASPPTYRPAPAPVYVPPPAPVYVPPPAPVYRPPPVPPPPSNNPWRHE